MSKDMLGSLLRVLVTVPEDRLGLMKDLALKLTGADNDIQTEELKKFLRKKRCWDTCVVTSRLKLLEKNIILPECDGFDEILLNAKDVFKSIDTNLKDLSWISKSFPTKKIPTEVHKIVKDGTFHDIFDDFGENFSCLCFSQAQIKSFVKNHSNKLVNNGGGNFFLFKVEEEFFVASVYRNDGGWRLFLDSFSRHDVWLAGRHPRVIVPQFKS